LLNSRFQRAPEEPIPRKRANQNCPPSLFEPALRGIAENTVITAVACNTGVSPEELAGLRKGGTVAFARCLAVHVGRQFAKISIRRMARHLHRDDSSFSRPLARLEARLATDAELRDLIDRIVRDIRASVPKALPHQSPLPVNAPAGQI